MPAWDFAVRKRFGTSSISSSALGAIGSLVPSEDEWEKLKYQTYAQDLVGPPVPFDMWQQMNASTNGSSTSPSVNVNASDLNDTQKTLGNMTSDQQFDLNSAFENFFKMIIAENDRINELSKQNTEEARRYSEYVYKNQAKWYVDGLKKAGINPLMIAHGLTPTPFTSMVSAQVFRPIRLLPSTLTPLTLRSTLLYRFCSTPSVLTSTSASPSFSRCLTLASSRRRSMLLISEL